MIWCRFQASGRVSYGIVEGDMVVPVEGSPFGENRRTSEKLPLSSVKLLVPVIPGTFYCAGVNYSDHVTKMAKKRGEEPKLPTRAEIGYRANNALLEHEGNIIKPKDSGELFQYEGELVAVFGKTGKHIPKEKALDYVLGWTIGNDVSERTWQRGDRTFWRGKNTDTFKPMGPWIVTGLHPRDMRTIIRLNGKEVESFNTGDMIFDAETFISETSRYCTIQTGDVMWMGTDGAPVNMKVGDTIEVEITGIGTLRNYIVAEA
jgi:2-keto-4-pentenoate hydratase/2-oxohepta-3-ene-1,7-dioic acid hydratase in catechol pathway